MNYILRSTPCFDHTAELQAIDDSIRLTLEEILNINLGDSEWKQASLPVSSGGLGIRSCVMLATPAFIASSLSSSQLIKALLPEPLKTTEDDLLSAARAHWQTASLSTHPPHSCLQRDWDLPICQHVLQTLKADSSDISTARLNAVSAKHASDWLNATPIANNGLHLTNEELRIAICLRLGLKVYAEHNCSCGKVVDQYGLHGFCCKRNNGKTIRHAALNTLIHREFGKCDVPCALEPNNLTSASGLRPDGITITPRKRGRQLVWDFTCTHTLSASNMKSTGGAPHKAAELAERKKSQKYSSFEPQYIFTPIAIESLGPYGPSALALINELGRRQALKFDTKVANSYLRQRISIEIQRGNAKCVLFALP